jgi:hypothetical protein
MTRTEICLCIPYDQTDGLKSNRIASLGSQREETCLSGTLFQATAGNEAFPFHIVTAVSSSMCNITHC